MTRPAVAITVSAGLTATLQAVGAHPLLAFAGGLLAGLLIHRASSRRPPSTSRAAPPKASAEVVLRGVLEAQPFASVLFTDAGTIVFTNATARTLFFEGREVEGQNFLSMLGTASEPLRQALTGQQDGVFSVDTEGGLETFLLSRRTLPLAGAPHVLLMVSDLTRVLSRQEVAVWKKAIRLMSHEVNNSLAPISSLMHSGRLISRGADIEARLQRVFDTVEERARHLTAFLDGYATFARLPAPTPKRVEWAAFLQTIAQLYPRVRFAPAPAGHGWFDEAQLAQVVINLVKNAEEAGGPADGISVEVSPLDGGFRLAVLDRGTGISSEVAQNALLPFYTTKENGSGLGLALCREVLEAHHGSIRLEAREGGGAAAVLWLPPESRADGLTSSRARLTVTRT